jgi:methyl-accepting chemotaxis protein
MRTWTFGRKIALGFIISAIALVVVGVFGYRSAQAVIEGNKWVAHSQEVRREIAELMVQLVNAETGQRGYVITGKEGFLDPYKGANDASLRAYAKLRQLTADNPAQQRRLDELKPALDAKLAELKMVIDQRRNSFETASATIAAGVGREAMETVRRLVKEMDDDAARLLLERRHELESATSTTTTVIVWGTSAAIILTILIGWFISTSLTKQVTRSVRDIQSSATELQTAANQQASGASEQATAMSEIATTIRELLVTSQQIAESAQRVSAIATQTATNASTGTATVARGSAAIGSVRKQVDLIVGHMTELSNKAQQVGAVLDIVSELAEQTNILAINATIEAAGAGESGRRFGVVADEIRKLADRVATATKEIRAMIDGVRGAVNTTVMATEAGSKAVDQGAAQVTEMATSFGQIAGLVTTTTDAAREIELSTKQQATAVEQVNAAIGNIAQASKESEASTSQTLTTAAQLASLSREMLRLVQSDSAR